MWSGTTSRPSSRSYRAVSDPVDCSYGAGTSRSAHDHDADLEVRAPMIQLRDRARRFWMERAALGAAARFTLGPRHAFAPALLPDPVRRRPVARRLRKRARYRPFAVDAGRRERGAADGPAGLSRSAG